MITLEVFHYIRLGDDYWFTSLEGEVETRICVYEREDENKKIKKTV